VAGPDVATKPDYDKIHGPLGRLMDHIFLRVFRAKLAEHVGFDSNISQVGFHRWFLAVGNNDFFLLKQVFGLTISSQIFIFSSFQFQGDFLGLIELTQEMNAQYSNRTEVQQIAQSTLRKLVGRVLARIVIEAFPTSLNQLVSPSIDEINFFQVLCFQAGCRANMPNYFPNPFRRYVNFNRHRLRQWLIQRTKSYRLWQFSSRMNAWATKVGGTWLMGECEVNDVVTEDGSILKDQGLLVKRCRFLEESGCASVCVNSCKIPTQNFFLNDMGLPLTMTPDYETYECQFSFGVTPDSKYELEARNTPCLFRCPTAGSMRRWHNGQLPVEGKSVCVLMENEK
jgi:hypothetical protein